MALFLGDDDDNHINGTASNDEIRGYAGNDELWGMGGSDVIYGGKGDDYIVGDFSSFAVGGNDTIFGGAGDDIIQGDHGDDYMDGGSGIDRVNYSRDGAPVTVDLRITGAQVANINLGHDTIVNFEGIIGSGYDDFLTGDDGDNFLDGFAGKDVLDGGNGSDWVEFSNTEMPGVIVDLSIADFQNILGESGTGAVLKLISIENISGSAGNDTLIGDTGDNIIRGGYGSDVIEGGAGDDKLAGFGRGASPDPDDSDTVSYAHALAAVTVNLGKTGAQDTIGAGVDTLRGFANLAGSIWTDHLIGNDSDNVITSNGVYAYVGDPETIDGKGGIDTFVFDFHEFASDIHYIHSDIKTKLKLDGTDAVVVRNVEAINFTGGSGNDHISGGDHGNTIDGGQGDDVLVGGDGVDILMGGDGGDHLSGGDGNDYLDSGSGWNFLRGGLGADTLVAGENEETFIYKSAAESTGENYDVIYGADLDLATAGYNVDLFNLPGRVTGIDAASGGELNTGSVDAGLASQLGYLHAHHATVFTPTTGDLAGTSFLVVDGNGVAGYQAGQDYVFALVGSDHLDALTTANFI